MQFHASQLRRAIETPLHPQVRSSQKRAKSADVRRAAGGGQAGQTADGMKGRLILGTTFNIEFRTAAEV